MKDGKAYGEGVLQAKTYKAEGYWKDDKMHGFCTYTAFAFVNNKWSIVVVTSRTEGRQEGEKKDGVWHGKVTDY